ncbi:RICIN domain-containing protein [Streptomyces natalensis]|uniref:Ricin B lectin domain-containing protein n=1 Tax=Streptomyces natalensis ATCC 27448 TaxID=1240678 RepID=A0A0D7CMX3_9ACTN|nr:RICIN domain-containing protein [Streptomyces natalensis]KIZ16767.1 hypothetical protein SNA_17315 [Streptomyces natalensis ATCC 27448]
MQGSSQDTTPKWTSDLPQLLARHDIIALQEAGPLPARNQEGPFKYVDSTMVGDETVYHYTRNFGTRTSPINRHVYFLETDPRGHRVNLAMVTENRANQIWTVPAQLRSSRAAFGLRYGRTVFFTVHARSRGHGPDVPALVRHIDNPVRAAGYDFAILGDFNREPSSLNGRMPANAHIFRSGRVTQQAGGELDYMIASRNMGRLGLRYQGRLFGGLSADHYPVEFGVIPIRAAAGFQIGSYSNHGGVGERVLDVRKGNSANGTHIITYDSHNGLNQAFRFVQSQHGGGAYVIRSIRTGKCLDLRRGDRSRAGDYVHEWDCQGQRSQDWLVDIWDADPGALGLVNVVTKDCLDVLGNRTGNGRWVGIWKCNGKYNQKWTFEYRGSTLGFDSSQAATNPGLLSPPADAADEPVAADEQTGTSMDAGGSR